jgi:hypothetical protein
VGRGEEMRWTKDKPKSDGWYYVYNSPDETGYTAGVDIVSVTSTYSDSNGYTGGYVRVVGNELDFTFEDFQFWKGPFSLPNPPKERK